MTLKEFLGAVLPSVGDYWIGTESTTGTFTQKKATTLQQAENIIRQLIAKRVDVYYGTASFDGARKKQHVKLKRLWYIDIDCKANGQYPDKATALTALKAALKAGLPRPTIIVDSGNGYHVLWVSDHDVSKSLWTQINNGLIAACGNYNLRFDSSVTTDSARVLRVPESTNFKNHDNPKPCRIVMDTGPVYTVEDLQDKFHTTDAFGKVSTNFPGAASDDDLIQDDNPAMAGPPSAKAMLEGCPVFRDNMANHGSNTPEPIWHKIIQVLTYTSDGHDYIHEISRGYPDYTPHGTEAKWNLAIQQKERQGIGATKCRAFADNGATQCQTCPHRALDKSPIFLSYRTSHDPDLPYPYRNTDKGLEFYDPDEEEWLSVYPAKLTALHASAVEGHQTMIDFEFGGRPVTLDLAVLPDYRQCHSALSAFGIYLKRWQFERVTDLVQTFMQQLHQTRTLPRAIQSWGWVGGGFHYAGKIYGATDTHHSIRIDSVMADHYAPCGDPAVWTECANYILAQNRPAAWCVLASAFGAPLMGFTGAAGALLSIVSAESGSGKSTVLKAAQAVWGDPNGGVSNLDDTINSIEHRLGTLNNLPSYWDEVRSSGKDSTANFVRLLFRLAQGKEKQRLTANIKQRATGKWATLLTLATNEPVFDHIAQAVGNSDAGIARVFEVRANTISDKGMDEATARHFYDRLKDNYGSAGEAYAKFLGENKDLVKDKVKQIDVSLSKKLESRGEERYWIATMTVLLAGASFAKALGLANFDLKALQKYLLARFQMQRQLRSEEFSVGIERAVRVLNRFVHDKTEYTVHADHMPRRGSKHTQTAMRAPQRYPAVVRIAYKDKELRIMLDDFKQWIYDRQGAGSSQIIEDLVSMGAQKVRGNLDIGTPSAQGGRHYCLDIPLTASKFRDLGSLLDFEQPDSNDDLSHP